MPKQILVLTVGLPRSGKSTWCKEQSVLLPAPIVSPDCFRLAMTGQVYVRQAEQHVWANVTAAVSALFLAGHQHVILDACSITRKSRDRWRWGTWDTQFKYFPADAAECIALAEYNSRRDLIPVIQRMHNQFDPLGPDEPLFE